MPKKKINIATNKIDIGIGKMPSKLERGVVGTTTREQTYDGKMTAKF